MSEPNSGKVPMAKWAIGLLITLVLALAARITYLATYKSPIQRAVEQAGGTFCRESAGARGFERAMQILLGQHTSYEYSVVTLNGQPIDDAWIAQHYQQLAELPRLHLSLTRTNVSNAGLKQISANSPLRWLSLAGTPLTAADLDVVVSIPALQSLDLSHTGISGQELSRLNQSRNLSYVALDAGQLSPEGIAALREIPSLKVLKIVDATDDVILRVQPEDIRNLNTLIISGEGLTSQSISSLNQFTTLEAMSLFGTGLTDPAQIQSLKNSLPGCAILVYSQAELEALEAAENAK